MELRHTGQPRVGILPGGSDNGKVGTGIDLVHLADHAMLYFAIFGILRVLWDALNIDSVSDDLRTAAEQTTTYMSVNPQEVQS